MNWFFGLFRSKWVRTGKDVLGEWPILYVHKKSGASKLYIQHFTPRNYIWAMRRASVVALIVFSVWCEIGYDLVIDQQKTHKKMELIPTSILVVTAIVTLYLPHFIAHKRMQRHPRRGPTLTVVRIKKGMLIVPNGERTTLDAFHSAHCAENPGARNEERAQALSQTNYGQRGGRFTARAYLYRDSSCVQVRAGHRGSRNLCCIEFYNDPQAEFAGLTSAAIDYAVMLAKDAQPAAKPSVVATVVRVGRRKVVSREI